MTKKEGCLKCLYLSKKPGMGAYFIWRCNYWGLVCKKILPEYIVASSIGEKCPFFKQKIVKKKEEFKNNNLNSNIDIII